MAPERLIGNKPNQISLNAMLGAMAFTDPQNLPSIFTQQLAALVIKLSRDGGQTFPGVDLLEVSDNEKLIASTGTIDRNTVPTQSAVAGYIDQRTRWGERSYGKIDVGTPGGVNFGIADPPFYLFQVDFFRALENRIAALENTVATLYAAYLREVLLRQSGQTIGTAGAINFGAGPAVQSGDPVGIAEQDYYPIHAASNSLM